MTVISVSTHLKELAADSFVNYCYNPGNAGDALIAQATFQVLAECKIGYRIINANHTALDGQTVIYAGGGNLTRYYQNAYSFISRIHRDVRKLIILPHTIDGNIDLLTQLESNTDIICREQVSYQHVQRYAKKANVYIADDMAFSLKINDVLDAKLRRPWHYSPTLSMFKTGLSERKFDRLISYLNVRYWSSLTGVINAFRTDLESSTVNIPKYNYDISAAFEYGTHSQFKVLLSCIHLLRLINSCRQIRTNRLHVAIAGALLGKEVLFYSNSYYKNRAVYDFSMRSQFPNVQWIDA